MHPARNRANITNARDTLLIFRLGSIGDTVVALPCFHAIARAYPNHRRVLLTNALTSVRASSAESVLNGTGLIDETIYYPVGDFSIRQSLALRDELRRIRPELLIYLAERPAAAPVFRDFVLFKAAGIPKILGGPWSKDLRHCRIDPVTGELEYEAKRLARMLARVVPVELGVDSWNLRLSSAEHVKAGRLIDPIAAGRPLLAIAPGARILAKDWGADHWGGLLAAVADECRENCLLIVGAPDERALGEALASRWRGPAVNLSGLLTPRETAAALARCRFLVCHDSGPMHLAASQGTTCIALFGDYNLPRQWYPFGSGHRVIHEPRGVREIGVQRVAKEVRLLLARPAQPLPLQNLEA
jgi:heptosyltransferase III